MAGAKGADAPYRWFQEEVGIPPPSLGWGLGEEGSLLEEVTQALGPTGLRGRGEVTGCEATSSCCKPKASTCLAAAKLQGGGGGVPGEIRDPVTSTLQRERERNRNRDLPTPTPGEEWLGTKPPWNYSEATTHIMLMKRDTLSTGLSIGLAPTGAQ